MNPEIKTRWVEALRSGEYKQGEGRLRSEMPKEYCCLGVLCELAAEDGVTSRAPGGYTSYSGLEDIKLPDAVQEWAELEEPNPEVIVVRYRGRDSEITTLAEINDSWGVPFSGIADIIEEHL